MSNKTTALIVAVIVLVLGALGFMIAKKDKNTGTADNTAAGVETTAPASGDKMAKTEDNTEALVADADKANDANDPVVAKVDGQDVRRSEVLEFAKNLPPQMQQIPPQSLFPILMEQVIAGKVIDEKAAKVSGLTSEPEYKQRMAEADTQIKRAVFLEKELDKNMTDAKLQAAYDKFKEGQGKVEEVRARHILVDSEDQAKALIKKLEEGAKFEELAKENTKDTSNRASGGDLGYFTKESMVKEFSTAAFSMSKGEYTKTPVKTQFGYHVILVEDKRNRPVPTLDEVRPQLEAEVKREMLNEMVENWRKSADVQMFDMNGNPVKAPEAKAEPKDAVPATAE